MIENGPSLPGEVYVAIEVAKGSRNKYAYSKECNAIHLDRVRYSPLHYPGEYRFTLWTCCDDHELPDALVIMDEPTYPGCTIDARSIGSFRMLDAGMKDDNVLCVPVKDPKNAEHRELIDVQTDFLKG